MQNKHLFGLIGTLLIFHQLSAPAAAQNFPVIRDSLYSETLQEKRFLEVILPENYKPESAEKFEVIYLFRQFVNFVTR